MGRVIYLKSTALCLLGILSLFFTIFTFCTAVWATGSNTPQAPGWTTGKPQIESKPATNTKQKLVTNLYYDSPVRDVLMDISTQTGVTIVPDTSVEGLVTCELKDVPLEKALDIVLASGNFLYKDMGDYILVGSSSPNSPSFLKFCESETMILNYIKPSEAVIMVYEPLRKFTTANDAKNAVSITAPRPILQKIMADIQKVDCPPNQILLEARVVVMETGDLLDLGVEWDMPTVEAGTYSDDQQPGVDWPWGIRIGYTPSLEFTNSLMISLNLLQQNHEANIISNSKVMAQDGEESEIKVTTEEYYEIVSSGVYTTSELETIEVGTILKITPEIADNGDITLRMSTEVSDVVARGADDLPVVTRRQAKSNVRVQDGGTVVLGGLLDDRSSITFSKTPGFEKMPVLGYLFKNESRSNVVRNLAIFVTPRLISNLKKDLCTRKDPFARNIKLVGDEFKIELEKCLKAMQSR